MADPSKTNKTSARPLLIAVTAVVILFLSGIFFLSPESIPQFFNSTPASASASDKTAVLSNAGQAENLPKSSRYDFKLSDNDTFYRVMSVLGVPGNEIQTITQKAMPVYDLKQLKKDAVLKVYTTDNKFEKLEYRFNEFEVLDVERDDKAEGGIRVSKSELPHEKRNVLVSGEIENSLYGDGLKAGADPQAIMAISDIFAWDVDFASDIKKGDTFSIYYEMLYVEGKPVKAGRILGAEMVNEGRKYSAIYYEGPEGGGYYDSEGRSLSRTLLKSPLRYRRITSYFTNRRFHPILKVYRPHHGIDYAAPKGTPVECAGSGKVIFAGWKNGYGNFIEVKHNNDYITGYGHLSRINRGIRAGAKVGQGSIIGFVGSTGISTGPHLHYEVRQRNKLINPLGMKSEPNHSVTAKEKKIFFALRDEITKRLSDKTVLASSQGAHPITVAETSQPR